jgi:Domain of unknown function (DUF3846)
MTSAVLVRANGEVRHIDLPVTDAHIMVHHMVGGWFDVVRHPLRSDLHAYVHDEGLILKQEVNVAMTYLFSQILVGDIVLSRATADGSETDFAIDEATIDLYKRCNTNEETKKNLQQMANETDTSFKIKTIE